MVITVFYHLCQGEELPLQHVTSLWVLIRWRETHKMENVDYARTQWCSEGEGVEKTNYKKTCSTPDLLV